MSQDLIVFDPTGLAGFDGEASQIHVALNSYVLAHETSDSDAEATAPIQLFLQRVSGNFLASYLMANGRYCNINQPGEPGNWENTIMEFSDAARDARLILLDPQGNNPVMTSPNGKGLLDF